MRKSTLALLAGVSMLALSTAAYAGDPIALSDTDMDSVTAAGTFTYTVDIDKQVNINVDVTLDVNKFVNSFVDVTGYLAVAEASADTFGRDGLSETETFAQVDQTSGFTEAFSMSLAATSGANGVSIPTPQ